jgi:hypothetical protein
VLLVGSGLVWWLASGGDACETRQPIAVTVAPELEKLTQNLLADPI